MSSNSKLTRRETREALFKLVFEKMFKSELAEQLIETHKQVGNDKEFNINKEVEDVFIDLSSRELEIDNEIRKYLNKWTLERISKISHAILRVAFYEMNYSDKVDDAIAINEAIEISKFYLEKDMRGFINGVLGSYTRDKDSNVDKIDKCKNNELISEELAVDQGENAPKHPEQTCIQASDEHKLDGNANIDTQQEANSSLNVSDQNIQT